MRSLLKVVGVRPEEGVRDSDGLTKGDGGTRGAEVVESLRLSQLQEQLLPALDGWDNGVNFPDLSWKLKVELLPVEGLDMAGDRALRKSR